MMSLENGARELKPLTSLRWFAALYVFLFHAHNRLPLISNGHLSNLVNHGDIAMSVYFILSGFVLTHVYWDVQASYSSFVGKRFARIYPVYLLSVVAAWAVFGIDLRGRELAFDALMNVFSLQGWFLRLFVHGFNGLTWSLTSEWMFYLLFPFLLPPIARLRRGGLIAGMVGCWSLCSLVGLANGWVHEPAYKFFFFSFPAFRLPEFVLGMVLAAGFRRGLLPRVRFGGTAMLFITLALFGYLSMWPPRFMVHNWIVIPLIGSIIALAAAEGGSWLLSAAPLVWLGEISYEFYLFHLFALHFIDERLRISANSSPGWLLVPLAGAILIAAASFYLVGQPARRWIRSRLGKVEAARAYS